jgi:putative ABC transport system permease protein
MNVGLLFETINVALRALAANRMRSLLALLGVVIGVTTVIGMVSLLNGFQRSFEENIRSLGSNTIYIRRIRPGVIIGEFPDSLRQRKAFTMGDARAILEQAPAVRAVAPMTYAYNGLRIGYRGKLTKITFVYGTDENFLGVRGYELERGRFFTNQEVERRANVVILGPDTREALFRNRNPIGHTVRIANIPFRVIGEYSPKGKFLGNNFDEVATIPYTVMDKYFAAPIDAPPWVPRRGEMFLDAIAVSPEQNEEAQRQIMEVLRVRRHLPSNKPNDFVVFTDDAFLSLYRTITGGITAVMFLIALVSLLVGGIGVMNIMLVAVTERTREIGIRKAVGAPRRAILSQFLIESIVLAALGGVIGILLGGIISVVVKATTPLPTYVSLWSVVLGLLLTAAVGIVSGAYPAVRASRLDPVDSLRYE